MEQRLVETAFTPNDVQLGEGTDLVVLTGPNASGKSCYLRQIGLIQLMAQIGNWVRRSATVGIADRIFTRVGAVDDLAAGQSTFGGDGRNRNILHRAGNRSLVLLDEIGQGTAFDGLSIAWAVGEHLAGDLSSRTVFATRYAELNNLALNAQRGQPDAGGKREGSGVPASGEPRRHSLRHRSGTPGRRSQARGATGPSVLDQLAA